MRTIRSTVSVVSHCEPIPRIAFALPVSNGKGMGDEYIYRTNCNPNLRDVGRDCSLVGAVVMTYLIMVQRLNGIRQRYAYRRYNQGWLPDTEGGSRYACGYAPPHYPVPALIPNAWCASAFVLLNARLNDWTIAPLESQMENLRLDLSGK